MAAFTYFLSNAILNEALRNVEYSQTSSVWAALFTTATDATGAGTEVTGGSYARRQITFAAASNGTITNTNTLTFPTATASWGTITHFGIMSASSGGSMLIYGQFTNSRTIATGEVYTINAGDIDIAVN
jgi:hypothetical protein